MFSPFQSFKYSSHFVQDVSLAGEDDKHEEGIGDTSVEITDEKMRLTNDTSAATKPHVAVQFPCHLCMYTSESRKGVVEHVAAEHSTYTKEVLPYCNH